MSFAEKLSSVIENAKKKKESGMTSIDGISPIEEYGRNAEMVMQDEAGTNILAEGDNLQFMLQLSKKPDICGQIKLIYIDPPFFSNALYSANVNIAGMNLKQGAYGDQWGDIWEYLEMICIRLMIARDLLAEDGTIWVHLDWHSAHYVKLILDEVFGMENFINEVIWTYKSGGSGKRSFSKKHDTLLFYGKSNKYYFNPLKEKSYNREFKAYRFNGVEEYEDEQGWYTLVNMKDVWQIDMVGRTSSERTGYATQKPETLLRRIIESSSTEGDLVADFFGGSGSFAVAAEKANRRWISCDFGKVSSWISKKRLNKEGARFQFYRKPYMCMLPGSSVTEEGKVLRPANIVVESCEKEYIIKIENSYIELTDIKTLLYENLIKRNFCNEDMEIIAEAVYKDSRLLIDGWSFDPHYDGELYRPVQFYVREKAVLEYKTVYSMEKNKNLKDAYKNKGLCIRYMDVFGNFYEEIVV